MRRLVTSLTIVCAVFAVAAAMAAAQSSDTWQQAISDCNDHGTLFGHYSDATLRLALANMPADVREYTDCYDVIEKQLFAQLGTSASGGSGTTSSNSGGSVFPTWLVVVIVVLALAALTFGALAVRRRRLEGEAAPGTPTQGGPESPGQGGPGSPGQGGSSDPGSPPGHDEPGDRGGSGPAGA
jgi:hypothetical protein